jgi:hypothetical protein
MLTACVMQFSSDTQTSLTPNPDDVMSTREFLGVSTFIKPNFRILVSPRSGELAVQVEAASEFKHRLPRRVARH